MNLLERLKGLAIKKRVDPFVPNLPEGSRGTLSEIEQIINGLAQDMAGMGQDPIKHRGEILTKAREVHSTRWLS